MDKQLHTLSHTFSHMKTFLTHSHLLFHTFSHFLWHTLSYSSTHRHALSLSPIQPPTHTLSYSPPHIDIYCFPHMNTILFLFPKKPWWLQTLTHAKHLTWQAGDETPGRCEMWEWGGDTISFSVADGLGRWERILSTVFRAERSCRQSAICFRCMLSASHLGLLFYHCQWGAGHFWFRASVEFLEGSHSSILFFFFFWL